MAKTVELKRIVEKMNLKNLTPDVELNDKEVEVPDINRPALQLPDILSILIPNASRSSGM